MTRSILVIGGGYAGVMAARTAADGGARVRLIDDTGTHGFLPRLATVAAGGGPVADAEAPLRELLPDVDIVVSRAERLESDRRLVHTRGGQVLSYDALVITVGAQSTLPDIPGLSEHAWTLRTPADALRLRDRVAAAEAIVIVGAGSTGTQLAGEISAAHPRVRVTLAETTERILPSLPASMGRRARSILRGRGVTLRTGVALKEVAVHGATFADGSEVQGLVVWTGGFATQGTPLLPRVRLIDGRVVVDRATQVPGQGPVFAAGDIAAHRGPGGGMLPQSAQVAVRAGTLAGKNALRATEGRRTRPSTLRHIGWVLPLGGGQAVAQVGPVVLANRVTSRLAPAMHDAIDLKHLFDVGGLPAIATNHQHAPASTLYGTD